MNKNDQVSENANPRADTDPRVSETLTQSRIGFDSYNGNQLDIIVPVKNEEDNVRELVARIDKALRAANINYRIIFVDDHSSDNTLKVIASLAADYPITYKLKTGKPGKAFSILEAAQLAQTHIVALIDGDLQYPPEKIPEMFWMMNYFGLVVANRSVYEANFFRKISSRINRFIFDKLLMGLDYDVQSGLKLFKKEIIELVDPDQITQWTIDIHLMQIAHELGYRIGSTDINFKDRKYGRSKINFISSAMEISFSTLKLRLLLGKKIFHIQPVRSHVQLGAGVAYKKHRYITHTTLPHQKSAIATLQPWQTAAIFACLVVLLIGLLINFKLTLIIAIALISSIYFLDVFFSLFVLLKSLHHPPEITFDQAELESINDSELPVYSILCPLYKEANILPQFIEAVDNLDWPKNKLDVILLLEEDDQETIDKAQAIDLPNYARIFVVPHSYPKTKPKACNFGLVFAKGEYVVIYDAEDQPDVLQLKKAYLAFQRGNKNLVCLQSKLNYYNSGYNLLTRLFTAEYSLWFDIILQGIQSINSTIPLGGTSNHFKTDALRKLQGWDPFNVTEDCDLGVRIFKAGYQTAIIDSTTLEEANSNITNWLRQRSRWIKGYYQTYLVHMRDPFQFFRQHGLHLLIFQLIIGMRMSFMLINPLLWLTTLSYFALYGLVGPTIEQLYPAAVFYIAAFSSLIGNFLYLYSYMIACAKKNQWSLVKYVFLVPFYWLLASVAAYYALYQLLVNPHYWEKTEHGLHLQPVGIKTKLAWQLAINIEFPQQLGRIWQSAFSYLDSLANLFLSYLKLPKSFWFQISANLQTIYLVANGTKKNGKDGQDLRLANPRPSKFKLNRLNILIFNWRDTKHAWAGGAEVYIQQMAKHWVKEGHQVTIFCGNDGRLHDEDTIEGINIIRKGGFYTVYIWAVIYYLTRFKGNFDLVIDSENGVPFFTPLFVREPKFLLVHHVHREFFRENLIFPLSYLFSFVESQLLPLLYREQKIITVSKSSKQDLEKLNFFKAEDIEVVNPGVDAQRYKPSAKTAYPSFVYLGRHKNYKNIDVALQAFARILRLHPQARLTVAGEGEASERLVALSKDLGIAKFVKFTGKVSEQEKAQLFAQSWVALQPSSYEGWGLTVIEANAAGTPVIASGVKGLRDSVIHGETGLLATCKDVNSFTKAMDWLISYPQARLSISEQAYNWAKEFRWDSQASEFLKVIEQELVNNGVRDYLTQPISTSELKETYSK